MMMVLIFFSTKMIVVLMTITEVDFRQNVHQSDIGQCADGDQQSETSPPVKSLSLVGVIDRGLVLGGKNHIRDERAEGARDSVGLKQQRVLVSWG